MQALAQTPPNAEAPFAEVTVVGTSPLLGSGIDRDKVPGNARVLDDAELSREGPPDLAAALERRIGGLSLSGVQNSPYQPDVQYRGFTASPLLGAPVGLAVYQNGVRLNEVFGDAVNWDLVPDFAINRVNLVSGNPVFGLNALGGALALEMKNGFTFAGGEAEASGGSFGRREGNLQYGARSGNIAAYLGTRQLYEEGWRLHSPSSLHQLYGDLGARGEEFETHLAFTGASNLINAIGPTPVELLQRNRAAVFTTPQATRNDLAMLQLTGSWKPSDALALDSTFYYRHFRQRIANGNTSDAQVCDPTLLPGRLCFGDGATPLIGLGVGPVGDFTAGAPLGEIDRTATTADGLGGALQLTRSAPLFGHGNHLVAGASFDHGAVNFRATSELGIIENNSALLVSGSGILIDQPDGTLAPVNVDTTNSYYGLYASDTFDVTDALSLTLSGRYNLALIRLNDLAGRALSGDHRFGRFNPAAGVTYKLLPELTAYAGYAEANRAPTPGELACADPARPCVLDNFLVSDPSLKQVVARSWELGVRGNFQPAPELGRVTWNLGLFRTDTQDEILNVPSPLTNLGFFENAGNTRRQGIEAGLAYRSERWSAWLDYSLTDATFQSALTLNAPNNPFADVNGQIHIVPGDHLPSVPQHRLKLGGEYFVTPAWKLGAELVFASAQYLRGDEANQNPQIPGYAVVNLHSAYEVTEHLELFGQVNNLFDERYETFGVFFNRSSIPFLGLTNPRSLSPAPPLAVFVGARARF
jgi:iron complex outermembrane receptor protein